MRVLAFSTYFLPYVSGAITYPQSIFRHWVSEGHDVEVLTFRYDRRIPREELREGVKISRLEYWFRMSKGFIGFGRNPQVLDKVRNADVVFLNLPNFEGAMIALLARFFRRPVVALFNCEVELGSSPLERIIAFCLGLSMRLQLYCASQIITYTEDYALSTSLLRELAKARSPKLKFIPPLIQTFEVEHELEDRLKSLKGSPRPIWIGFCGRVSREKGLEHLIEALVELRDLEERDSLEWRSVTLVMAGPYGADVSGEQEYFEKIQRLLAKHQLKHHFLGLIPTAHLGAVYQSFDLMVLPSLNKTEAFGIVQAEALCYGTWLVTSDLPGVRSCVRMTSFGALAKPGDSKDLAQKIKSVLLTQRDPTATRLAATKFFDNLSFKKNWTEILHFGSK
jgi:glycosyltransferase involved in cell wall biosynthesis